MLVGLTGGIGCGKSTSLALFKSLGWHTIDADEICRDFYRRRDRRLFAPISKRWGERIILPDGSADKKQIAEIIFTDRREIKWFCSLFHPLIFDEVQRRIKEEANPKTMIDMPLLYELHWDKGYDWTVAVWADKEVQYRRLYDRGWDDNEIERRIKNQMPSEKKLELSDFGLINTGNVDCLFEQCRCLDAVFSEILSNTRRP